MWGVCSFEADVPFAWFGQIKNSIRKYCTKFGAACMGECPIEVVGVFIGLRFYRFKL